MARSSRSLAPFGGKIREEKKPPDETVFEGSEVEEIGKDKDAIEGSMEGVSEGTMKGVLIPKEPHIKANGGERLEGRVLVQRCQFYMAKVLGYIVTEEKGDAEHTKAICMPGIIINKSEYKMELRKKE